MYLCSAKGLQFPPAHGTLVLIAYTQHPAWVEVWILVWVFIYFHTLCIRAAKALASLCICTDSPESSLLDNILKSLQIYVKAIQCTIKHSSNAYYQYIWTRKNLGPQIWLLSTLSGNQLYSKNNQPEAIEPRQHLQYDIIEVVDIFQISGHVFKNLLIF